MILLFAVAGWIVVLSLVAGLCTAARVGDAMQPQHGPAPAGRTRSPLPTWEPIEDRKVATRATVCAESSVEVGQRDVAAQREVVAA